jgi:RNA polymerase sigma-70 factor, ECF subfamily
MSQSRARRRIPDVSTMPRDPETNRKSQDLASVSDEALVAALQSCPEALGEFYRRYVRQVTRFAAQRCSYGDSIDIDGVPDVVSQTFIRAITGAGTFESARCRGNALVWVLGIAANVIRDEQRRTSRRTRLRHRVNGQRQLDDSDEDGWAAVVDVQRLAPTLEQALAKLSAAERDAVLLVDVDGFDASEAASILRVTPVALRARVSRGRRRLRRELGTGSVPSALRAIHS